MIFIGWVGPALSPACGCWSPTRPASRRPGTGPQRAPTSTRCTGGTASGLAFLGAAIVVAATTWWHLGNAAAG